MRRSRRAFAPSATWSESAPAPPGMLSLVKRLKPAGDDPRVLWLRPEWGYGDHLMLTAILAGLKAEHPTLRIRLAAAHPEIFRHNPHVEEVLSVHRLGRKHPERLARYLEVVRRPPEARYLQVSGHLLDDMYDCIGIPLKERPRQPYIYLTWRELRFRGREVEALPRPRIAIAAHGAPDVKLPNKVYPAPQWLELVPLLARLGGSVLQIGTRTEGSLIAGARDYRDLGYRHTASLLKRCDLLVTHVGGIMHLGTAVRVPTVVLYGAAEHPEVSGYPWNLNLYTPIECGPCWMREPCSHHSCMRRLTPQLVLEEVEAVLAGASLGSRDILPPAAPQTA